MANTTERTVPKQFEPYAWQPGQSGNPAGRPKGSRNKLGEEFVRDLLNDWQVNGIKAIEDMRAESPTNYCKVIASVIPKEVNVTLEDYDNLSDDELAAEFAAISQRLAARHRDSKGDGAQAGAGELPN